RRDAAVAALAHEIRNPLQSILNAAQSLHLASAAGSANSELCDLVTRQARLLARLADELIEAARVGAGKTALKKEAVDLSGAMAKAIESVNPAIRERRHQVSVVPPLEPVSVSVDALRLEQMLVNLLSNAAQYTDPGGHITLDAWRDMETVAIRVRDDGMGI